MVQGWSFFQGKIINFFRVFFQAKYVNSLLDSRLVAIGVASTENGDHNSTTTTTTTTTANNDDFSDENNPPGTI
jgi:hypothetical protein